MSGTPTEAEIQTQWKAAVNVLEKTRAYADGTVAGAGHLFDVLEQAIEGEYTPDLLAFNSRIRAGLSSMVDSGSALEAVTPILYEYGKILAAEAQLGFGSGYSDRTALMRALYDYYVAKSYTIKSRTITYDTSATAGAGDVGNGSMSRLTVDENNFNLEACHVEKKTFLCRSDANTGADAEAEVFEFLGTQASKDALLLGSFGSGEAARTFIRSHHAGSGNGGSLLTNSSFSDYVSTATPKFTGWTETAGGASVSQDTGATHFYRTHPGATTDASLKITGGSGTVTLTQPLSAMKIRRIDRNTPYFLRVMLNADIGSASGGTVTLTLGSQTATATIASITGSQWVELIIAVGTKNWPATFNTAALTVAISWASSTSGYLLVDDVLFAPWDLIDGTYWFLRGNAAGASGTHAPWALDDSLTFTDSGGAPGTGILQYWLFMSGLGYLPSSGSPTIADPT